MSILKKMPKLGAKGNLGLGAALLVVVGYIVQPGLDTAQTLVLGAVALGILGVIASAQWSNPDSSDVKAPYQPR